MRDEARVIRAVTLVLAALFVAQMVRLVTVRNPLAGLEVPSMAAGAPAPAPVIATNQNPKAQLPGMPQLRAPTKPRPPLPPEVQARVEKIKESEIFGPVSRPLPMALLGIAGEDIFLRAPTGQTGRVKEGGELGGVKVLRIGTNRVLVEHEGAQKELTIFSGLGSESMLSQPTTKK